MDTTLTLADTPPALRERRRQRGSDARWRTDVRALVAAHAGPALAFAAGGRPVAANDAADRMAQNLREGGLAALAEAADRTVRTRAATVVLVEPDPKVSMEFVVLPTGATAADAIALGRDVTLDRNLRQALVDSRQRYKDLAACAADGLWETDRDGAFVFVAPPGALGFAGDALVGRPSLSLRDPTRPAPREWPFVSDLPVHEAEVWVAAADGRAVCLLVSAVPVTDALGAWKGARGVWRDVTARREREAILLRARKRERLVDDIVAGMRDGLVAGEAYAQAVAAIGHAVRLANCLLLRLDGGAAAVMAAMHGRDEAVVEAAAGLVAAGKGAARISQVELRGRTLLVAPLRFAGRVNGALVAERRAGDPAWSDDDRDLVAGVAAHLGIVVEQAGAQEALRRLSNTDGLTGLLNRRAFVEECARRVVLAQRLGRPGALLMLDLDHFKRLNDTAGHLQGDAALADVGRLLSATSRNSDLVGRLGGDEFALWCDGMDESGAIGKARAVLDEAAKLAAFAGDAPIGMSVGVAVTGAGGAELFDDLVARADAALYAAKRAGRGRFALAPDAARRPDRPREGEGRA